MKSVVYRALLIAGTALSAVTSTSAFAQTASDEASDAIVVTARRVEERLQDVPISITVYNQQALDNRNVTTATDLAIYTPSLTSNNRFGADKASFTIRGFNQEGKTAPTVAVYFADVVAIRANSGTGGSNGTGPGSFFDLQNVQVLKGPQGTLFGRNTTGGAILLVPQRPTDQLEGYVEGSAGNYDMLRAQAVLNVPLSDTFRVRLGVDRQKRDGYLHNRSNIGPKDFADLNYIALRGSILADLTPDLENYLVASYNRSDTNGPMFKVNQCNRATGLTGRPALFAPLACAQIDRQTNRGDGFYDIENVYPDPQALTHTWQIINTTTWTASDSLTIKNVMSYGEYQEIFRGSIGGEFWTPTSGPLRGLNVSNTTTQPAPNQYNNSQSAFTEELQFSGHALSNRLTWQAGAYLELSNPLGTGDTTYSTSLLSCTDLYAFQCIGQSGVSGLGLIYVKVSNRNIGFYGQGTYQITDKLAITAGARYTMDRMQGHGGRLQLTFGQPNTVTAVACSNPKFTATLGNFDPRQCDSGLLVNETKKPTWVVDLEYKPISDVMVYAKYSRGYRQGGVDPSVIGLESWASEKVDNYEIGTKASFSGGVQGYFNFAAFYNDFSNQQLALTVTGKTGTGISGARAILNAGKSKIWGIEADASVTLFDSLRLDAGYTYLNTELSEFVSPTLPATSPYNPPAPITNLGIDLPYSPHHRLALTGTYTLPLDDSIGKISIGATYVYTSAQVVAIDVCPLGVAASSCAAGLNPYGRLPSSNLVNLNLNWNSVLDQPIDLAFFVTNLTKEKFPVSFADSYVSSGYEASTLNVPRMYGVRLKYRFGGN